MSLIEQVYIPSRQKTDDAELDAWIEARVGTPQGPSSSTTTPEMSLTITPKGPAATETPGPMGGMLGSNVPNVMADRLSEMGQSALSGISTVLKAMFDPPLADRVIRYLGGTPSNIPEEITRDLTAAGVDPRLLPGLVPMIEGAISQVHTMGPGKPPRGGKPPPQIGEAPVDSLTLDPQRFQYKVLQGEGGTTGSLSGVQTYDPNLAGIVQVWRDPANGQVYVVNGHNRVALAKNKGIATIPVRYLNAATAEEAKQIGAMTNIAEGRGSAIDAAKLFRESRTTRADLEAKGIPLKEKVATEGLALSNLHESLFAEVVQGQLPLERALIIGERVAEPDAQLKLVQLLRTEAAKGRRISHDQVRELADFVDSAPTAQVTKETLFGAEETVVSLALDKARIAAAIRERLSTDKTLFAKVGKEKAAERLTAAGNVINVEESQRLSQQSASLLQIFDHLKNATGEISDILNDAARQIQAGGKFDDIRNDTYQRLTEALPRAVTGSEGPSVIGAASRVRTGEPQAGRADLPDTGTASPTPGVEAPPAASGAGLFDEPPAPPSAPPPATSMPPAPEPPPRPPPSADEAMRAAAFQSPGRFNPAYQHAPPGIVNLTATINVQARDMGIMQQQTRGRQTWTAMDEQAQRLIANGQMSLERIMAFRPGEILNAEEATAARSIRDAAATVFKGLMDAADAGDEAAKGSLEAAGILASRLETNVEAATGTEVARALAARRHASSATTEDIFAQMAQRTIDPNVLLGFWRNLTDNTQQQAFIDYFEQTSRTGRWVNAFLEARQAGLLTIRSLGRNLVGSAASTIWSIPERAATAITGVVRGTDEGAYAHEALDMLHGIWNAQMDALITAGKTLKTGEAQVIPGATQTEQAMLHAISGDALGITGPMGRFVDVLGEMIRLPFRGLAAGDDYFKFINYEAEKYALAYRRYRQLLTEGATNAQATAEYTTLIKAPPEWLDTAAAQHAMYTTFNDDIINPLGQLVMDARAHESGWGQAARFIVPFARTPMNVMGYGAERTPGLNFLSAHYHQEILAGGVRKDAAYARLALGAGAFMAFVGLAMDGHINGQGPKDPKLRDLYRQNGWSPYSINVPGMNPIPFLGFSPLSEILGQAADFAELVHQGGDEASLLKLAGAMVLSSASVMEEYPMLQGLADVADAIRQTNARSEGMILQALGSTMPLPGLQGTARTMQGLTDPHPRETRSPHGGRSFLGREVDDLWEELATRTPWLSNYQYPTRDILGQPMLRQGGWWTPAPTSPSAQGEHPVIAEMVTHKISVGKPPRAFGKGRQREDLMQDDPDATATILTPAEWDRFQELAGTETDHGLTLDQHLRQMIVSDEYQAQSDGPRGGKADLIRLAFQEYRQLAKEKLLEEGRTHGQPGRLEQLMNQKEEIAEFEKLDKADQARARPDLERRLGRPVGIGILR